MRRIGGRPIPWHIMKIYDVYGYNDFVICLDYKGQMIRDYFLNYETQNRDFTVILRSEMVEVLGNHTGDVWQVTLAEPKKKL
jgi:glucose-1-phosphate cytidylyltransferase